MSTQQILEQIRSNEIRLAALAAQTAESVEAARLAELALRDASTGNYAAKPAISYYIRAEFFWYPGTYGAPQNGALRDEAGNRLEFATRAEAAAYLCEERDEWNYDTAMGCSQNASGTYSFAGTYICSHGEYARPLYAIRKVPAKAVREGEEEGSK
jgi:hypothetical protein